MLADFTNIVPKQFLLDLADVDEKEVVQSVQEHYMDFYAHNQELFTLNITETRLLDAPYWAPNHHHMFSRILDGLTTSLLAFKKAPVIRYQGASAVCRKLALALTVACPALHFPLVLFSFFSSFHS